MDYPIEINPCPIIDAILELRFSNNNIPKSAIVGMVYNVIKSDFPKMENLPIFDIPEHVRNADPNLKFKPLHLLKNDKYVVQLGSDVIVFGCSPQYVGWNIYSSFIYNYVEELIKLKLFNSITRIGLRYINFFDTNIFNNINTDVFYNGQPLKNSHKTIFTVFENHPYQNNLTISNSGKYKNSKGSIIDIDSSIIGSMIQTNAESIKNIIEQLHKNEKELFFNQLKKEFLQSLNPKY